MKKLFKRLLYVLGVLAVLFMIFDIYGRKEYNPKGNDKVSFSVSELKPGKNKVEYLCNGSKVSALLFLPDSITENHKLPAVVLTPPNTGVKEQTASLYAEKLSKKGFVTLAFDPRGFGNSGSHPVLFDLKRQIEDVKSSIDFVSTLPMVDKDNLFNMGICVGAAISTYATSQDDRIKAQAMISPVYLTEEDNILPVPLDVAYAVSGFAKLYYNISGNDIELGPLVVETPNSENEPETSLGAGMDDYYLEGKPGYAPSWKNHFSMISMGNVMEWFDFFEAADKLDNTPVFMVYGTEAFSRKGASKFYDMLSGSKDKMVVAGAGHFDMYWMPEYVNPAVENVSTFLKAASK